MSEKMNCAGRSVLRTAGAVVAAVGVVTASAVIASGIAAGSMAMGFKTAGAAVRGIWKKEEAEE